MEYIDSFSSAEILNSKFECGYCAFLELPAEMNKAEDTSILLIDQYLHNFLSKTYGFDIEDTFSSSREVSKITPSVRFHRRETAGASTTQYEWLIFHSENQFVGFSLYIRLTLSEIKKRIEIMEGVQFSSKSPYSRKDVKFVLGGEILSNFQNNGISWCFPNTLNATKIYDWATQGDRLSIQNQVELKSEIPVVFLNRDVLSEIEIKEAIEVLVGQAPICLDQSRDRWAYSVFLPSASRGWSYQGVQFGDLCRQLVSLAVQRTSSSDLGQTAQSENVGLSTTYDSNIFEVLKDTDEAGSWKAKYEELADFVSTWYVRGVVLVEGFHDYTLLNRWFGLESKFGLVMAKMDGTHNLANLDLGFAERVNHGQRTFVILDRSDSSVKRKIQKKKKDKTISEDSIIYLHCNDILDLVWDEAWDAYSSQDLSNFCWKDEYMKRRKVQGVDNQAAKRLMIKDFELVNFMGDKAVLEDLADRSLAVVNGSLNTKKVKEYRRRFDDFERQIKSSLLDRLPREWYVRSE